MSRNSSSTTGTGGGISPGMPGSVSLPDEPSSPCTWTGAICPGNSRIRSANGGMTGATTVGWRNGGRGVAAVTAATTALPASAKAVLTMLASDV